MSQLFNVIAAFEYRYEFQSISPANQVLPVLSGGDTVGYDNPSTCNGSYLDMDWSSSHDTIPISFTRIGLYRVRLHSRYPGLPGAPLSICNQHVTDWDTICVSDTPTAAFSPTVREDCTSLTSTNDQSIYSFN